MGDIIRESPFWPGSPAPAEIFVGRDDEISSITRYIDQNSKGRQQHVFLYGDRGIGKSSLASYVMNMAKRKNKMIGIHIFLDGTHDVKTLVKDIVENLLDVVSDEKWYDKIKDIFSVESVNISGINIKFNPNEKDLDTITRQFPEILKKIVENIKDEKDGIFIILDDINGLTENADFANWYKSFVDTVGTKYPRNFPIFMMLVGPPGKRIALFKHNQSFMRIFKSSEIKGLELDEVKEFFIRTFGFADITVDEDAMQIMVRYSSGMPTMMHEIGDAVFWLIDEEESNVNSSKAIEGVFQAGTQIGRKYLQPNMINIQSETYKRILKKLGEHILTEFSVEELKKILNEKDKSKIHAFLKRCKELGIIVEGDNRGEYKFVNNLYPVYFLINGDKI